MAKIIKQQLQVNSKEKWWGKNNNEKSNGKNHKIP